MIKINVTKMFAHREPWDCSNSVANLGERAGELTWACATEVADNCEAWLLSSRKEAIEAVRSWARNTGAWDAEEIDAWSDLECIALLVQNVASDLRELGSDDLPLDALAGALESGEHELSCIMHVWNENNETFAEVYLGI